MILCALLCTLTLQAQTVFRAMSYNVENLFDCQHDSLKDDLQYLPDSKYGWTEPRYRDKLKRIAQVIAATAVDTLNQTHMPDLVALCEVENDHCLTDLVKQSTLRAAGYEYVMTDSPDARGVDVALLYQPGSFRLIGTQHIRIPYEEVQRKPTRDILHATGVVQSGDTLDVFVCHMPSRAGGQQKSEFYRLFTSGILRFKADSVQMERQHPNVLIMGDFNDYPDDRAIHDVLGARKPEGTISAHRYYNLMAGRKDGSYRFHGEWGSLDHLIVSGTLLQGCGGLSTRYEQARVLNYDFLLEEDTRYGGQIPSRTYLGPKYHGGYSDHLPVCVDFLIHDDTARCSK
jgi:predicted extracellular nuclease